MHTKEMVDFTEDENFQKLLMLMKILFVFIYIMQELLHLLLQEIIFPNLKKILFDSFFLKNDLTLLPH